MADDLEENGQNVGAAEVFSFASDSKKSTDTGLISTPSLLTPSTEILCLFCEKIFQFYKEKDEYLAHLYLKHRLVIADEDKIGIFHEYLLYWREKFNGMDENLPNYCTTMLLDQLPDGTPSKDEKYYLLCDVLPQDAELRQQLHKKRLEQTLEQHQLERIDTKYSRACLFCRDSIETTRSDYVKHLFSKHFLQLGKPENLVYIDELIDTVQSKLNALICVYCEKVFRDRPTLKEHMRKKGHKRINPNNTSYDRFFLVNYQNGKFSAEQTRRGKHGRKMGTQEGGKSNKDSMRWQPKINSTKQKPTDSSSTENLHEPSTLFESDNDSNWSDWDGEQEEIKCLYCMQTARDFAKLKVHMNEVHRIDFDGRTLELTFYERIKVVNFIRRQMELSQCVVCDEQFTGNVELEQHMNLMEHCSIGSREQWDRPEYYFPTREDDPFLCSLNDVCGPNHTDDEYESITTIEKSPVVVVPEDSNVSINLHAEALSKERLSSI